MSIEVVYDCPGNGQVRLSIFEAARRQLLVAHRERGKEWCRLNGYQSDQALVDFMTVNWAWLEIDGVKYHRQG